MSPAPTTEVPSRGGTRPPVLLVVAAGLACVEGLVLAAYGFAEAFALTGGRVTMGITTAVFFLGYGLGLVACAWAAFRLQGWSRAPLVLAQLIQLGVAWSLRGGSTTPVALALAAVAVVVLAGVLHPASTDALVGEQD